MKGSKLRVAEAVLMAVAAVLMPEVSAVRYVVGDKYTGWSTNVNYRIWARSKHFYTGDWLFLVYDRNKMNVLEVNKLDYDRCIARRPVHNWTTGAGRDVVPLKVAKTYYFISGKGACYKGIKVAIRVEKAPPHHLNGSLPIISIM